MLCVQNLTGKSTANIPLRNPRPISEDNIRMDLTDSGINTGNRVDSVHDMDYWRALVNAVRGSISHGVSSFVS